MLGPDDCLVWDGAAFAAVPHYRPILPGGAQLLPAGGFTVTPEAVSRYTRAMVMNPRISAFLAPGIIHHGYRRGEGRWLHEIMLEHQPDIAAAYEPRFREFHGTGLAFAAHSRKHVIYAQLRDEDETYGTICHELFHTVYANIPECQLEELEDFGDAIREANNSADPSHDDVRSVSWIMDSEEAEAYAFGRYAQGSRIPFGLKLPRRVRATFDRALRGDFAHHMLRS